MDIYKIAFIEFFLIAILAALVFGSNLKAFEYKVTRFLRASRSEKNAEGRSVEGAVAKSTGSRN
jgi:hypothetical protein